MAYTHIPVFYMCPKCLEPADEAVDCPRCGGRMVQCRPGDPGDPCRRPLMSALGQLKSQAPVWWLQESVSQLPEVNAGRK